MFLQYAQSCWNVRTITTNCSQYDQQNDYQRRTPGNTLFNIFTLWKVSYVNRRCRIWLCNALWYWKGDKKKVNPARKNDYVVNLTNWLSLERAPTDQNVFVFFLNTISSIPGIHFFLENYYIKIYKRFLMICLFQDSFVISFVNVSPAIGKILLKQTRWDYSSWISG